MRLHTWTLAALFCLLHLASFAQTRDDYVGEWFGYITQTPAGLASRYVFGLDLEATEDGVTGEARLTMEEDSEIYGIMDIKGSFEQGQLYIVEQYIKAQYMYIFGYWCLKDYRLTATWVDGILVLEGQWNSNDCGTSTAGFIHLERRLS